MAAALDHGRRVGGPALRELTFHQRAALLKALASTLREHREELYALSRGRARPGPIRRVDVDGGLGVLFSYASKGKRELPNDTMYVEGDVEPLSKGGTFLAGAPSLVKPASQTAYLTARLVELIIESGLLPEGALQLVCGSAGDLLDHLTGQDLVSFIGSAATARKLRVHPAVVREAVRFNAEADSLNCSILGPTPHPARPNSTCSSSSSSPR
jgi:oxepin-CoA hydrolase/3-oxo-5,6-dehydrosuberyl-CoA semialdehyde dehydrogenase